MQLAVIDCVLSDVVRIECDRNIRPVEGLLIYYPSPHLENLDVLVPM